MVCDGLKVPDKLCQSRWPLVRTLACTLANQESNCLPLKLCEALTLNLRGDIIIIQSETCMTVITRHSASAKGHCTDVVTEHLFTFEQQISCYVDIQCSCHRSLQCRLKRPQVTTRLSLNFHCPVAGCVIPHRLVCYCCGGQAGSSVTCCLINVVGSMVVIATMAPNFAKKHLGYFLENSGLH